MTPYQRSFDRLLLCPS